MNQSVIPPDVICAVKEFYQDNLFTQSTQFKEKIKVIVVAFFEAIEIDLWLMCGLHCTCYYSCYTVYGL